MHRRLIAGALAAACALAIAACGVQLDGAPTGAQRDVIGDVVITTKLCSTGNDGCGAVGVTEPIQSILAYRVPAGAKAPALTAGTGVAFHRDDDLAQWYEDHYPADGTRWYAFVSDAIPASADQELSDSIDADFPLPAGAPYRGPFAYRVMTGFRELGDANQVVVPITCMSQQPMPESSSRVARDDVPSEAPSAECDAQFADGSVDTRDLALSAAATSRAHLRAASVQAGSSADVPFAATFAGASTPDADFALTASAPGLGAATVSPSHLVPETDSTTPLTVHVDVPAGTAPGDYPVTLTARLANGRARTATGTITVTAPPAAAGGSSAPPAPADTTTTSPQGVTFTAPSTQTCVSRRVFTIMLLRHGRDIVGGTVTLNGRPVAVTHGNRHLIARIDLRGLPQGIATVHIHGRLAGGRSVSFTRRYRTCTTTPGSNELARKQAI